MFTELVDRLRCPAVHEESWLVASAWRTDGRRILDGEMGCPVCQAEYRITAGVASFGAAAVTPDVSTDADADRAVRLAALLHLTEGREPALLVGARAAHAVALTQALPHAMLFVANAAIALPSDERLNALTLPFATLPFATGAIRGMALDAAHAGAEWIAAAARVLRAPARLVMPSGTTLPATEWTTLADDGADLVAERTASAGAFIPLRKAPTAPLFPS
jgi:hypothetical protein